MKTHHNNHQSIDAIDKTWHQLSVLTDNPETALAHMGNWTPYTWAIVAFGLLVILYILNCIAKAVMADIGKKRGLFWTPASTVTTIVMLAIALSIGGFAYIAGNETGETSSARIQGATQQITAGP